MAAYEVLLLNTAIPQIQAAQSGDTYVVPRDIAFSAALTLTAGTANGVPYLSSPGKVLTTGSALTFDGSANFSYGGSNAAAYNTYNVNNTSSTGFARILFNVGASGANGIAAIKYAPGIFMQIGPDANDTTTPLTFAVNNGSEQMRLTSTGLGIGTNNPAQKLHVSGVGRFARTTDASQYLNLTLETGNVVYNAVGSINHVWQNAGTEQMRLDSSGNLGLGVTPSAKLEIYSTNNAFNALQVRYNGSNDAMGFGIGNSNGFPYLGYNTKSQAAVDAPVYERSNPAAQLRMDNGSFKFNIAPSGTANTTTITNLVSYTIITSGNQTDFGAANNNVGTVFTANASGTLSSGTVSQNISFTQAMTLDASGNLGVGETNPAQKLTVAGAIAANSSSGSANTNYATFGLYTGGAIPVTYIQMPSGGATEFWKPDTGAVVRITNVGNVKIGGTADRATTEGTAQLVLFNGTAPVGTLANGVSFYSAAGEANVMDAAGNATLLSPHDAETNEWIFRSKHTPTGKVLKIDVERLLKFVNDHFGLDAVHEFIEK